MNIFWSTLTSRLQYAPILLAMLLILSLAVVQGRWSDRWGEPSGEVIAMAARLSDIPLTIDGWEGQDQMADARQLAAAGAVGHVARTYRHQKTGAQVSLFIICGHSRDVSVHTPRHCYPAAGFTSLGPAVNYSIDDTAIPVDFRTAAFRKEDPEAARSVRVLWTWGYGGRWFAPEAPRSAFAGVSAIYKLYLVSSIDRGESRIDQSPGVEFGKVLIPALNPLLNAFD